MGLLEGHSTAQSIDDAFANFNASNGYLQNAYLPPVLQKYLDVQRTWMDQQVLDGALAGLANRDALICRILPVHLTGQNNRVHALPPPPSGPGA